MMASGWKTAGVISLVLAVLGAILVGVGFMTGADTSRIYSVLEDHFLLNATADWIVQILSQLF